MLKKRLSKSSLSPFVRKKREAKKAQEEAEKRSQTSSSEESKKTARVAELSKMLKDRLITDEEFKILGKVAHVVSE